MSFPVAARPHGSAEPADADMLRILRQACPADDYLDEVKQQLQLEWPRNRTVNLVFHGHSVPAGYFRTPVVNTQESYPFLVLKGLKAKYPYAVVNAIVTAIGGENAAQGAERFGREVLCHRPDVLFIDYALNDQRIGLAASREAWGRMIGSALEQQVKVVLLTATPDQRVDIAAKDTALRKICDQIADLAAAYRVGIVDSYGLFREMAASGGRISDWMSQVNHPNAKGHQLVADAVLRYF